MEVIKTDICHLGMSVFYLMGNIWQSVMPQPEDGFSSGCRKVVNFVAKQEGKQEIMSKEKRKNRQ